MVLRYLTIMVYIMVTFCMSSCSLQHSGMYLYRLSSAHSKIGILCMVFKGIINGNNNLNRLLSAHSKYIVFKGIINCNNTYNCAFCISLFYIMYALY